MKSALQSAGLFLCQDRFWRPNTLLIAIHSSGNEVSAPETLELVIRDELGILFSADDGIEWAIEKGYFISQEICEMHGVTEGVYDHPGNTLSSAAKPHAAKVEAAPVTTPGDDAENEAILTKREKQIQSIENCVDALGYQRLAIPDGGKKILMNKCKEENPKLFGAGDDPFLDSWKRAVKEKRIRMKNYQKYSSM